MGVAGVLAAAEAAGAVGVIVESGAVAGFAARLPALLVSGFVSATGPDANPMIRAALLKTPAAKHLEHLAEDD